MLTSRQKRRAALLKCCVRLTLLRGPEVRRLPGRSPPIALRHLRYGVSSRLRSRRTTFLVSPGPGTEHRGMRTDLRGPAATAHCLTCGRWSHSRYLLRAPGQVPRPPRCRRARGLPRPRPPASYRSSGAPGWANREWQSAWAPGLWSCQVSPPSALLTTPPSSMPATTRSGSAWESAIARTWEVQGLGGKLQVGAEGRFLMPSSSRQDSPPSRLTNRAEGSVPA